MKRKIIEIKRELCDGCGLCTKACAEGALELDGEGKACLVRDIYCDGLGACLDVCPTGALRVVERDAPAYDEEATVVHVVAARGSEAAKAVHRVGPAAPRMRAPGLDGPASELGQWPIQLRLVSPASPFFRERDLLIAADCTAFALGSFHAQLLRGKALVIACPKLDRTEGYAEKLVELIEGNALRSITVAIMDVPCCTGLSRIAAEAVERSGARNAANNAARNEVKIEVRTVVVGKDGRLRQNAGSG